MFGYPLETGRKVGCKECAGMEPQGSPTDLAAMLACLPRGLGEDLLRILRTTYRSPRGRPPGPRGRKAAKFARAAPKCCRG